MQWADIRNNTSFVTDLNKFFKELPPGEEGGLRYHQMLMNEYFLKFPVRGLLIFHKMGMGKTRLAASIVDILVKTMSVIFISAKTLHQNFEETLQEKGRVKYVSLNASNMFDQINMAGLNDIEKMFSGAKKMRGSLDNTLVVLDEAHNFFNSIANGSGNATNLYKSIMKSSCRILFLTGSPIMNDPFECALCFNMLAGYALFPESYRDFKNYFIGPETIKNEGKFMNRINGMVSFYDGTAANSKVQFPEKRDYILVECDMSALQYKQYFEARKVEQEAKMKKTTQPKETALQKSKSANASYRVMSRQVSNFAYPIEAVEKKINDRGKTVEVAIFELLNAKSVYDNMAIFSPKMKKLIDNCLELPGINIVYSQFLKFGLGVIELYFEHLATLGKPVKYTVISGEVDKEEVYKNIEIINSTENKNGDLIKVVLISGTASEGIDFKRIMQIHILEPYWHWSRMEQIIGRGVRANSHVDMPANMQYVQPYIYISKTGVKGTEISTDEHLYTKSLRNHAMIGSFYSCMKLAAVDCPAHYGECRVCLATGKRLFNADITADMTVGDPCAENKSIEARIFKYGGETYAEYQEGGETYFAKLNTETGKYEKVSENIRRMLLSIAKR